ncbi:MAG: glycosyltransferase [Bacteroidota bacterium]
MKVLHLFDRYLNSTMNWAYKLIKHTPEVDVLVSAPILIKNQFLDPAFHFLRSPYQSYLPRNEWNVGPALRIVAGLTFRRKQLFQQALHRSLKNDPPDLIHAHFAHVGCSSIRLASLLNCPLVVSFYGYDYEKIPTTRPKYKALYQELFRVARLILTEGVYGRQVLIDMGCPPEKVQVLHLGILPENVPFVVRKPKVGGPFRILQAATFTEKKGQLISVEALAIAREQHDQLSLSLIGEFTSKRYFHKVRQRVKELDLEDHVDIKPFVAHDKFYAFLEGFDLFLHPSCYAVDRDCEGGAPIVLLDAQANGLPVVSTQHCDIPEEVLQGKTGLLVPEKDPQRVAEAILQMASKSTTDYAAFSRMARKHVEEQYDVRHSGQQLLSYYRTIVQP